MATPKERMEGHLGLSGPPLAPVPREPLVPDHELLRRIGFGSYGEVWLARSIVGQYRAIKVVYRDRFADERPYEREFSGIQKFEPLSRTHQGLVQVLQIGRKDAEGYFYYVMELADDVLTPQERASAKVELSTASQGETLRQPGTTAQAFDVENYVPRSLQYDLKLQQRLSAEECVQLGLSLSLALGHLHRHGLIHRDVKPSNIIFVSGVPKLADIGLVTEYVGANSFVGTEGFVPPEGPNSPQADLYGLGKVLYEASMGKDRQDFPEPFTALAEQADSSALLELNAVLLKACATEMAGRYSSAEEMHVDLALLQSGDSVRRKHTLERRLARLKRTSTIGATVTCVAAAAFLWQQHETRQMRNLAGESRNIAYASDMALAQEALRANKLGQARGILERHRPALKQEDLRGFEWRYLWGLCRGDELYTFRGHSNGITSLAISPDAKLLATASSDETVRVWDLNMHALKMVLPNGAKSRSYSADSVAFSPDSRLLAVANSDRVVVLEVGTWKSLHVLTSPTPDGVRGGYLVFSSDGRWLVCRVSAGLVVWETITWQPTTNSIQSDAILGGGAFALSRHGQAQEAKGDLWDLTAHSKIGHLNLRPETQILTFSPDSRVLAAGDAEGFISFWDMNSLTPIRQWKAHASWVCGLAFSPDGRTLASGGSDELIQLWDAQDLRVATTSITPPKNLATLKGHQDQVWALAFSPDGQLLASGDQQGSAKLWRAGPRPLDPSFTNRVGWIWLPPDGSTLIADVPHSGLQAWDLATGERTAKVQFPTAIDASARQISPDGRLLLQATMTGHVRIWNLVEAIIAGEVRAYDPQISSLTFSRDSHHFATASTNGTVQVWNVTTLQEEDRFAGALSPQLSSDSRLLAAPLMLDDSAVLLRDIRQHRNMKVLRGHNRGVGEMAFSPRGDLLATGSKDSTIQLWHIPSGQPAGTLTGHNTGVEALAFSPDGKTLVTAANYDSVKFWQVATRQEMLSFPEYSRLPTPAVFSANGTTLAIACGRLSASKVVSFWRAPSWKEIETEEASGRGKSER